MAGESAQAEYLRIREARRSALRRTWPWLAAITTAVAVGFYLAFERLAGIGGWGAVLGVFFVLPKALAPSQREAAWRRGAEGEQIVGNVLDRLREHGVVTLHDRRIPRSRANLDHVVVGPHGVYTVDAKRYRGELRVRGGRLFIAGRDRSKLLDQARRQREVVASALAAGGFPSVPVTPVLCFVGVGWPLLRRPDRVGDVVLARPSRLETLITPPRARVPTVDVAGVAAHLDRSLPPMKAAPTTTPSRPPTPAVTAETDVATASPSSGRPRAPLTGPEAGAARRPTCGCGAVMVVRTRRRDGAHFLGCSTFPTCRRTRALPDDERGSSR